MVVRPSPLEVVGMNREFWKGRRILLTGHTGFKGAWLSIWLQKHGAQLIGYALPPPTDPGLFALGQVAADMVSITGDVRDLAHLKTVLSDHHPDIVIHLAAQALVRKSYVEPVETFQTNVMGTVNVLEAARSCDSVRVVLIVTSDKCYDNREWIWPYRENEPLGGSDPYSSSKAAAELATTAYRRSFFDTKDDSVPRIASVRAGNVIGGGDWARDRLVPDCIQAFTEGRPLELRYPRAVRPWQHVLGPLAGYMTLAERLFRDQTGLFCEAWNFGPDPDDNAQVGDVAARVALLWGAGSAIRAAEGTPPRESAILRLDATKARTLLGWRPVWGLSRAIEETVSWYKAWTAGDDMRAFTLDQIAAYEAEADCVALSRLTP